MDPPLKSKPCELKALTQMKISNLVSLDIAHF